MPILFIMRDCPISLPHDAAARISSSARKSGYARCKRICIVHLFILFIMNCTPRSRPAPLQAGGKLGLSASPDRFIGAGLLSAPNGERELAAALHTTAAAVLIERSRLVLAAVWGGGPGAEVIGASGRKPRPLGGGTSVGAVGVGFAGVSPPPLRPAGGRLLP